MFGRRVFASAPIPRHLYARLHIQTSSQAARRMPSLAPLSSLEGKNASLFCSLLAFNALCRSSAGVGEGGGQGGELIDAEVAAAGTAWALRPIRGSFHPFTLAFTCSPCWSSFTIWTKMIDCPSRMDGVEWGK
ncbi:unnamed protein product [Phytomonas sp. EM1]|nr:unnamed protein product [Phytomonas sp. EM1]|eukprot:CCW64723.1 unnamed protein product [Phytomonas sp. isolate EM1]